VTLPEFLLQRIAEDERHARKLAESDRRPVLALAITVDHPQRILAECEAKRRIVGLVGPAHDERDEPIPGSGLPDVLAALALPYADHPDYREEWKP
jgi:hypothetical protein